MTWLVVFRPQAEAEVLAARHWYEERRAGLGDQFRSALDDAIDHVSRQPESFPRVHGEIRRALVQRFPFGLYFETSATRSWCSVWCMATAIRGRGNRDVEA